jgi:hypothetical protein
MAIEDAFMSARAVFTFLDAYVNTVSQEIGRERALALMTKACESIGAMRGKVLKEQSGIKEFDAKTAWSLLKSLKNTLGESHEVLQESPQRVLLRNGRCPFYEAGRTLGMDANTIETGCRAGSMKFADTVVKQLNPNLNLQIRKFRSTLDDFCEEEIVLG